jgi:hydrogenase-4 component B
MDRPMTQGLSLVAIALLAISGVPGLFLSPKSALGERIAVLFMAAGSLAGLACAVVVAATGEPAGMVISWGKARGAFAIEIDAISALFLGQICLIAPLGSIFGLGYWSQADHPGNGRKLRLFYGLLAASLVLLVVAKSSILFLMGLEMMALAAFLVVTTEDTEKDVRESGFVYLVATRIGTLCLFAMFALLRAARGDFAFAAPSELSPPLATAIFVLALLGFGLKAGVMPLHVWLPGAHANAPSHVSALMSGVLIKMGIYGLIRVSSFFEHPPFWWGIVLLSLGVVSGVLGVAFAIGQHDLKRLLAYHSVENIGIIVMGLGLAVMGRSLARSDLVALGLAGALLHVLNHGLFKALLFMSAGAVLHATGTREIDRLGGLAKRMPRTALAFLVGAVAICGLPPLNGFVSELLVYLGLLRSALLDAPRVWIAGAFGAPLLALIGALAVACFAKVFSAVFLGSARSQHTDRAKECGPSMTGPMAVLAACCVLIGLFPRGMAPVLDHAKDAWAPDFRATASVSSVAPLAWLSFAAIGLVALLAAGAAWIRQRMPRVSQAVTWDCGFAAPSPRMQYTASSFAELIVGFFGWALRPEVHRPRLATPFPQAAGFSSHVPDAVLERVVLPASRGLGRVFSWFRWIQHGNVHVYLLYVLATLVLAMLFRR